ncbi:MAG: imidazole glycerol phosphate synthase subunit HisH [Acidobacteriaceae bacterium]|nr:imidazole glycerol phosphate synthase subunit HisH [Acidobacteriaceae bacterium]
MRATIVDYGAGNLRSVQNTLEELDVPYVVTNDPEVVSRAEKLILPGVGHFGQMMQALDHLGLCNILVEQIRSGVSFLGICVGLQCLFESSEESPGANGLGILPGQVKRFNGPLRVPHMGWNSLDQIKSSTLLKGLNGEVFTYFAHSYYAPVVEATAVTCTYIQPYSAVIEQGNLYAVQFHPEKSGPAGLRVLKNFIEL